MFFLDHHFSHNYATFAFLPFFLAISTVHGLLVKCSGSIQPSVALHAVADFIVIPILYGLVGSFSVAPISETGFDSHFAISIALVILFGIGSVLPFQRLAAARREQGTVTL